MEEWFMRRFLFTVALALGMVATTALPVAAITGGQPDGDGHPYGALLLVPGVTFCSGTLIDEDVILTAGHCTDFWSNTGDPELVIDEVLVSFSPQAEVDEDWNPVDPEDWYVASSWTTHPDYVSADWPFTFDYGLVYLDEDVTGIEPAILPELGLVNDLIGEHGQTPNRFLDVGYGQNGVTVGGGTPQRNFTWTRKVAVERYRPGKGSVSGIFHPTWFITGSVPSDQHGGGCGGDSGSGIFPLASGALGDTILAVHTGGYRLGPNGVICGRITSLNHRVDIPEVLDWINADAQFQD
jgi:hypothetical protein